MSNSPRLFMRHLVILILTTTIVSCYTTTHMPSSLPSPSSSHSLAAKNYTQLNDALHYYQSAAQHPWPTITIHQPLKLGDKNQIIPLLRDRLRQSGDLTTTNDSENNHYDAALSEAIKSFQIRHGLNPTGLLNKATLAALNVTPEERVKQIQINIQRWSKLNNRLTGRYILVNIPDYHLSLYENDKLILSMRTIVGKPELATPQIFSRVTRVVFNPYWHIPNKIAKKDILPKLEENPEYLDDMNIKVIAQQSNRSTVVDESEIDWDQTESDQYLFRQDPGEKNALGVVKFEFPNPYDVYMHDTSARNLFSTYPRDLSHGCIRLEKPFDLVNYLMKNDPNWNNTKAQLLVDSKKTTYIPIQQSIPIVITYITAWVDDYGKINFRDDIYHLDS